MNRVLTGLLVASVLALGGWSTERRAVARERADANAASAHEAEVRDLDIAFFEARAERDPYAAGDRSRLANLLLARARATGRYEDLVAAEQAARASLDRRRGRNRGGALVLINALMGQHRFREALDEAGLLETEDSTDLTIKSLTGEILLELGRHDEAKQRFDRIGATTNLAAQMRLVRWRELNGDLEGARQLLLDARSRSLSTFGLTREQRAWFELRVGEFAMRYGHSGEARAALGHGLAIAPDDYRLTALAAREALARGDWVAAADFAGRSLDAHFDPASLALLAQAERGRGDSAAATAAVDAMTLAIRAQPGAWHRAWSLALLDEGRELDAVLEHARRDLHDRQDVYAWDLYAWALYRTGDVSGARAAMQRALVTGLRDPQVLAHAQVIDAGGADVTGISLDPAEPLPAAPAAFEFGHLDRPGRRASVARGAHLHR